MNFLKIFYSKTLKYEFFTKFTYKQSKDLPELKKIILNVGCRNSELKNLSSSLLALELITSQKGVVTKTKYPNVLLKIRKGNPTGCKVTLRKMRMFNFLTKILIEIISKQKNFNGFNISKNKSTFSYKIQNILNFKELENQYYLFNSMSSLDVTIVTNAKNKKELLLILKSLKFPFKIVKQI
nr:ribosomal protein L5 [Schizostauron trachyderma]